MRLAGKNQSKKYIQEATDWFTNHRKSSIFADVKRIVITAVSEYIANQDGKTMFKKDKKVRKKKT